MNKTVNNLILNNGHLEVSGVLFNFGSYNKQFYKPGSH